MCACASKFRGLLAGTFNKLVKAVALAADGDVDDDAAAADNDLDGTEKGRIKNAGLASGGQSDGQPAAGVGKAAGDSIKEDGEVCHVVAHYFHAA